MWTPFADPPPPPNADVSRRGLSGFAPGVGEAFERVTAWLFGSGGAPAQKKIRVDYDPRDEVTAALPIAFEQLGVLLPVLKVERHRLRIVHDPLECSVTALLEPNGDDGKALEEIAAGADFPGNSLDECILSCECQEMVTGAGSRGNATRRRQFSHGCKPTDNETVSCYRSSQDPACDLWPDCQCDGDCNPFAYKPVPDRVLWILAGAILACFAIAAGLLGYLAWQALS